MKKRHGVEKKKGHNPAIFRGSDFGLWEHIVVSCYTPPYMVYSAVTRAVAGQKCSCNPFLFE